MFHSNIKNFDFRRYDVIKYRCIDFHEKYVKNINLTNDSEHNINVEMRKIFLNSSIEVINKIKNRNFQNILIKMIK